MQELGLTFQFFDAIDGAHLSLELETLVDKSFSKARRLLGRGLSPGEIGCALSHVFVYKKMIDEGLPAAYVLEDDAYPSEAFAQCVKACVLPNTGALELATFYHQPLLVWRWSRRRLASQIEAYRPMEHPWGCVCYYLTRSAAIKLLEGALPISGVADWPCAVHEWKTVYCISPRLVETDTEQTNSTLHAERSLLEQHSEPYDAETMKLIFWTRPWRLLGRLLSLTLVPCVIWPETFGTVENTCKFAQRAWHQLLGHLFGTSLVPDKASNLLPEES